MNVLLSRAVSGQCRWIVRESTGDKRDLFGGRRVCGAAVSHPTSYCLGHRLVVYQRTETVSLPPADFAVLRRQPETETLPDLVDILS